MKSATASKNPVDGVVLVGLLLLCGAVFALDCHTPLRLSAPMLYGAVVLLSALLHRTWVSLCSALLCSTLTMLGLVCSHGARGQPVTVQSVLDRILVCGMLIGTALLIRRRSHAEQALDLQKDWLRSLVETTQDAVISIDEEGHIILFNQAAERIFGYTQKEVRGKDVALLMPDPYHREHRNYLVNYHRSGKPKAIGRIRTVSAKRKDGTTFPIELSVTEVRSEGRRMYGAFIRDISEKVFLQEQVVEKQRLASIGTTAAKLAHEIGNPLNGMSLSLQLIERRLLRLAETVPGASVLLSSVGRMREGLDHLIGLLQEFRALSRRQRYLFSEIEVGRLLEKVLETQGAEARERQIEVVAEADPGLRLEGDRDKLLQVLLNLCKNALEAMPSGGTLTLRAFTEGVDPVLSNVVIEVTDTGAGIEEGVAVFDLFVTTKATGTGLGLPICQQIVDAHQGRITYSSEKGKGTTFRVILPQKRPSSPVLEAAA